jgi:hypothetical protein
VRKVAIPSNPELESLFCRVDFNWRAILAAGHFVSRAYLSCSGPLKLGYVYLRWFTRNGSPLCHRPDRASDYPGAQLDYPEKGDSAVTVGQAATPGFGHPWMSEKQLEKYQKQIEKYQLGGRVRWNFPAYDVKGATYYSTVLIAPLPHGALASNTTLN